jgi:hypothetical protein
MRRTLILALLTFAASATTEAWAVQKFIPAGHSNLQQYADQPRFGSPTANFDLQSDIYETENYKRQREAKEFDNRFRRFFSSPNYDASSPVVDY